MAVDLIINPAFKIRGHLVPGEQLYVRRTYLITDEENHQDSLQEGLEIEDETARLLTDKLEDFIPEGDDWENYDYTEEE